MTILTALTPDEILTGLNRALLAERQAQADYQAHADACEQLVIRQALEALRDVEQEHAQRLRARIAALGGTPTDEAPGTPSPEGGVAAWLQQDLCSEQWAIGEYARLIAGIMADEETVELVTELLFDEIRHANWLKATLHTLEAG